MRLYFHTYAALCGRLLLGSSDNALLLADWVTDGSVRLGDVSLPATSNLPHMLRRIQGEVIIGEWESSPIITLASAQLDEYFRGERREFSIPLEFVGTEFQHQVWMKLSLIPYGSVLSYRTIAQSIGAPRAVRGVAAAIGANRMSVFIPCHRVLGSDGSLTGYAGGIETKRFLLDLESRFKPEFVR